MIKFLVLFFSSISLFAYEGRIVTIDGSITEIVFALGEGDNVVGRDTTSLYPEQVKKLPDIGYMRALSAEGILSLRPDLVIATKDVKPKEVITKLQNAGVNILLIDNSYSIDGVLHKIQEVAKVLNKQEEGEKLAQEVKQKVSSIRKIAQSKIKEAGQRKAIFMLNMQGANPMVAGNNTRGNAMLDLAGIINPASSIRGYKPMNIEAMIQYDPHYLIYMSNGRESNIMDNKIIKMTTAGKNNNLIVVNGEFLAFGPRIADNLEVLVNSIYQ